MDDLLFFKIPFFLFLAHLIFYISIALKHFENNNEIKPDIQCDLCKGTGYDQIIKTTDGSKYKCECVSEPLQAKEL